MKTLQTERNYPIIILGYMGSGKSSIAKNLAEKLKLNWIDLDKEIEISENMKISNIFKFKGEIEFRKIENIILIDVLKSSSKSVISLGGGTPCYYNNMELINKSSKNNFYINTSNKILSQRLYNNRMNRPIISQIDSLNSMKEFVSKHLFERIHFYNMANYKINSNNKNISEISKNIIEIINQ